MKGMKWLSPHPFATAMLGQPLWLAAHIADGSGNLHYIPILAGPAEFPGGVCSLNKDSELHAA